jgi:L-rhamnose mutarotase
MRQALALDLQDDPRLIAQYEEHHRRVWPEVLAHLREQGVVRMEIYRLGTRLFMLMETDDRVYDAARMAQAAAQNPAVRDWEALMWRFQVPTPWTAPGEKWATMKDIFRLERE